MTREKVKTKVLSFAITEELYLKIKEKHLELINKTGTVVPMSVFLSSIFEKMIDKI
jgi:hypothetical protein